MSIKKDIYVGWIKGQEHRNIFHFHPDTDGMTKGKYKYPSLFNTLGGFPSLKDLRKVWPKSEGTEIALINRAPSWTLNLIPIKQIDRYLHV